MSKRAKRWGVFIPGQKQSCLTVRGITYPEAVDAAVNHPFFRITWVLEGFYVAPLGHEQ